MVESYALTALFCVAIGVLLWLLGLKPLQHGLIVSLSIGLSINTSFVLFEQQAERWLPPYLAPIPLQIAGLGFGLILGAWLTYGDPWFFFRRSQLTLVLGLFFGVVGYLLLGTRARLAESKAQLALAQQQQADQQRQLADNRLKLLQAQIEPHFLFNTLSNVSSLIHTDPDAAEATVANLSMLLRQSLKRTREQHTTLAEELQFLEAYLNIQKIRLGARLQVTCAVPAELLTLKLAPLLLQPLVENAVIHGIEPKPQGGSVGITASMQADAVLLAVTDTGVGIGSGDQRGASDRHNGTALRNIRERLQALYGDRAQLRLLEPATGGVRAELLIPASTV